jgi:SAM-dependent methyltransferase
MNQTALKDEEILDGRMQDVMHLLDEAPLKDINFILDIGAGQGQLAKHFARQGKKVTCTGVNINSYVSDIKAWRDRYGLEYVECDIENMPFPDASFDAVIMCHVLEHCPNIAIALGHARRVLREGGLLLVFVPPVEDIVCAGHISVGWNVGQLMYVLLLNGFDVRSGHFIEYGYNVCGFVRRSERLLPELRFDQGDISILSKENYFPVPIRDGNGDNFYGNIKFVNWPNISDYRISVGTKGIKQSILSVVLSVLPSEIRSRVGYILLRLGRLLVKLSEGNPNRLT